VEANRDGALRWCRREGRARDPPRPTIGPTPRMHQPRGETGQSQARGKKPTVVPAGGSTMWSPLPKWNAGAGPSSAKSGCEQPTSLSATSAVPARLPFLRFSTRPPSATAIAWCPPQIPRSGRRSLRNLQSQNTQGITATHGSPLVPAYIAATSPSWFAQGSQSEGLGGSFRPMTPRHRGRGARRKQ